MKVVIDTSVAVKWVSDMDEQNVDKADLILEKASKEQVEIAAPIFMKYEMGNALEYKKLAEEERFECLRQFYDIPIKFYPISMKQAVETLRIALKMKIPYYDAIFMELAQRLDAELVTANTKHQKSFEKVTVVGLENYK